MISNFADALESAAIQLSRDRKRATCWRPDCSGSSPWTVQIWSDHSFCHRCRFFCDAKIIEREFNIVIPPPSTETVEARSRVELFGAWLETIDKLLRDALRTLGHNAETGKWILNENEKPTCQACQEFLKAHPEVVNDAWDAMANFYHSRAALEAALEFISFEPVPNWLEEPMTAEKLFRAFEEAVSRGQIR